jgi:acetolactate synthase I/II/III large subunit
MKITVAELVVRYLERLGIETIFGIPGAHVLPVYDQLHGSAIKTVLAKHEQGAAFMAGGYARVSGRIGACIATAGPGATNLVTGVANAYADKQALLIITGEAPTYIFGRGGLQEGSGEGGSIDQVALFAGITRYAKRIERTDYLVHVFNQAAKILFSSQPGPVLLSFPYNIQKELVDAALLDQIAIRANSASSPRCSLSVEGLADLVEASEAPVIVSGYGSIRANAQAVVAELSSQFNIPVATSLKGKGVIGDCAPLSLGSLGVTSHGHAYRYIAQHADLLVFLGAGFNERTSYLWDAALLAGKKIAQIDHDAAQLEKVFHADVVLHADLNDALEALLEELKRRATPPRSLARFQAHGKPDPVSVPVPHPDFRLVQRFFARLEQACPENVQIFDDNIIFAQNYFHVSAGNRYYPNSGISSLGHAIPAAIGAAFWNRAANRPGANLAILGDGGFQMCGFELMTAVNYGIPLTVVVFNNATMGLIRKNQVQSYGSRFIDCDFANPDFALLAKSMGIAHHRIAAEAEIEGALAGDLNSGIRLIEIVIDKNAFPDYVSGR